MRYRFLPVDSQALAGNLLGDANQRDVIVYESPRHPGDDRRPRLVVMLHGLPGRAVNWLSETHYHGSGTIRPALAPLLDEVFADPDIPPAVVAMPDGSTLFGGGQWADSSVNGNLTRYVAEEVVGVVEEAYGTDPDPASRVVLGHSSGGAGAWEIATTTSAFGSLGFSAGDAHFERNQLPNVWKALTKHPDLLSRSIHEIPLDATGVVAIAAAYSPDPSRTPLPVRLPIDPETAELDEEVWALWLAKDPVVNAADRVDRLKRLTRIVLDSGDRDEYSTLLSQRVLSARLTALGVPHAAHEFPGTHSSHTHQRMAFMIRELLRA